MVKADSKLSGDGLIYMCYVERGGEEMKEKNEQQRQGLVIHLYWAEGFIRDRELLRRLICGLLMYTTKQQKKTSQQERKKAKKGRALSVGCV